MNTVVVDRADRSAQMAGGARAADVVAATDPLGMAAVTGSVGAVGMGGLTLGGGYGALIGRFGLALDNLLAAEVVLADGCIVVADKDHETELFWAFRGGGGNFGVVTAMRSLSAFDAFLVNGRRTFMETCWLPELDDDSIDVFVRAAESAVSPTCAIFTHELALPRA
jgi:hypothetical protein